MGKLCSKGVYAFTWTLFECLFFSGVVMGWSWFMVLFRMDGYFVDLCNATNITFPLTNLDIKDSYTILDSSQVQNRKFSTTRKKCRLVNRGNRLLQSSDRKIKHTKDVDIITTTEWPTSSSPVDEDIVFPGCFEQTDHLGTLFSIVFIIRDILTLPLGIFLDEYGTTRTRLLTVLVFAIGTLMMTFTKAGIPWLVVPALSLTAIAGTSVLLTNLQIGNLFSKRRHIIVSMYIGAQQSGSLVALLIQLSRYIGVNVQSSFMFMTVGIVPLLVSTIAFLPKSRIPWPLPADYGKRRNQSLDEMMLRKQRAWQRRMSEVGFPKYRRPHPDFSPHVIQSLYIWAVIWFSVQNLQTSGLDTVYIEKSYGSLDVEKWFGCVQLLGIIFAPMAGAWMDKRRPRELGLSPGTQQMTKILPVMICTSALGVAQAIVALIPMEEAQICLFVLSIMHRMFLLSNFCAFIMHLHFPQQHFGKFFGLAMCISSIISAFQFPIKNYIIRPYNAAMYVNIFLLVLCLVTFGHPLNVWNHCTKRLIRDPPRFDPRQREGSNQLRLAIPPEFVMAVADANCELAELVTEEVFPMEITGNGDIPEVIIQCASDSSVS